MELSGIPISHGLEVEQDGREVPDAVLRGDAGSLGRWERDPSGPRELEALGPYKQVKSLLSRFVDSCEGNEWDWHNTTSRGDGCGSHAHLAFDIEDASEEDKVTGTTVAWNTAVELTPFLAPFFCADWESGFRSSINRWASPEVVRYSRSTVRQKLNSCGSRAYSSVTFNPSTRSKPVTIELRLNEAHPSFSVVGLTFLRRTIEKGIRREASPKLAGDRRRKLEELYEAVYEGGVIEGLKSVGPFRFEEGRGIPGSDQLEYETAWDVLQKIFAVNGIDKGAYDDRVKKLVQAAGEGAEVEPNGVAQHMIADGGLVSGDALGPQNNPEALWETTDDDFSWQVGPEVA